MPKTVWRDCREFPNYEINRLGKIRNKNTKKELNPYDDRRGYLRVSLNKKHVKIHRLMAIEFLPPPCNKQYVVNHKNGNKHDNRVSNLEWISQAENVRHAIRLGLRKKK